MSRPKIPPLARALGRVPCGLYIVATSGPDGPLGLLASLVMQTSLDPPTLGVAIGRERPHLDAIRHCGHFTVSILDERSRELMGRFFRSDPPPFEGLDLGRSADGDPWLSDALAWVACRVTGESECEDHVIVFGKAVEGDVLREGDPAIHLRKDGRSY